jgi:hypothetical protein
MFNASGGFFIAACFSTVPPPLLKNLAVLRKEGAQSSFADTRDDALPLLVRLAAIIDKM